MKERVKINVNVKAVRATTLAANFLSEIFISIKGEKKTHTIKVMCYTSQCVVAGVAIQIELEITRRI